MLNTNIKDFICKVENVSLMWKGNHTRTPTGIFF